MMLKALVSMALLLPVAANAGPLSDLLMPPGIFAGAPAGNVVAYAEDRSVPEVEGMTVKAVADGRIRLEAVDSADARELRLVREVGGAVTPLGSFPVDVANPTLLYFLETTVQVMAEATGGSPYYIRNRIREALVASDLGAPEGEARQVTLTPFAADANRARMGAFGDLAIGIGFDPAKPARILELSADTVAAAGRLS